MAQTSTHRPQPPWSWPRQGWLAYAGFWLAIGVALALAESQHPQRALQQRAWEPFVLEISSLLAVGLLALWVHGWVAHVRQATWPWWGLILAHTLGAALFFVAHVTLMHLLRMPFYALLADRLYAPMTAWQLLLYEGPKDLVTYVVVAALSLLVQTQDSERRHREQAAQARAALAELQLERMAEQLQPHFLFNCLNSVTALIEEDPAAAIRMVARIGDFLRASLDTGHQDTVPLGEELRLAELYLAIQQVRFDGSIRLRWDVEEGTRQVTVPRLVLQPLVENAVKHGTVRPREPIELRIHTRLDAGQLLMSVSNRHAPPAAGPAHETADWGLGLGLRLVRERLAHGGERAALSLRQDDPEPGWFSATVSLPMAAPPS